jgi:hypothetical protein
MEYVNARWMQSLHGFLHGITRIMFHDHLDYFQKSFLGGRPNTPPGGHGTPNADNCWVILFYHVVRVRLNRNKLKLHLVESPVTYDFTLHLKVCDHIRWFWRHLGKAFENFILGSHNFMVSALGSCLGYWLMCEVALSHCSPMNRTTSHLVTDERVEFEKELVEIHQDLRKRTDYFRGISRITFKLMKENRNMSMCSRLDLKTWGSEPIMPKIAAMFKSCSYNKTVFHRLAKQWKKSLHDFVWKQVTRFGPHEWWLGVSWS